MSKQFDIAIIGGDLRQVYMANLLIEKGYSVITYCIQGDLLNKSIVKASSLKEIVLVSKTIIGPIPFSRDKKSIFSNEKADDLVIENFLSLLTKEHLLFAGSIDPTIHDYCKSHLIQLHDVMDFNEVSILNSISTAEGTILEAIKNSTMNLHSSKCLVLGYGKCAKILAKKLQGLDAKVWVGARKGEDRFLASAYGYNTMPLTDLVDTINQFDYIFNTIPAMILDKDVLLNARKEATIIDIASAPGGTDFDFAKKNRLNAALCLGLPGKYAPSTSANILVNAILNKMKKEVIK